MKNIMEINKAIKVFNSFINFVNNKIDYVLSREGELPSSYFVEGLEERIAVQLLQCQCVQGMHNGDRRWSRLRLYRQAAARRDPGGPVA